MIAPNPERNRGARDAYRKMRRYINAQMATYLPKDDAHGYNTGRYDSLYEMRAEIAKQVKRAGNRKGGEGRR